MNLPNIKFPDPAHLKPIHLPPVVNPVYEVAKHNFASTFYKLIVEYIIDFEKGLDDDHEVGARLVNFGVAMTIHVEGIGFSNPSLICFNGRTEDGPVQLIQHVTQLNFLLTSVPRVDKTKPRIGFKLAAEQKEK